MKAGFESLCGMNSADLHLLTRVSESMPGHAGRIAGSRFWQACAAAVGLERLRRTGEPENPGVSYSFDCAELTDAELKEERLVARQMREKCARDGRPEASLLADLVHLFEDECHRRRRSRAISDLVEKG
jgi:hypothetical protein